MNLNAKVPYAGCRREVRSLVVNYRLTVYRGASGELGFVIARLGMLPK